MNENEEVVTTTESKTGRPKSICVQSEILLYKIADMGWLEKLNGVGINKYHPNRRVWYFDQDENIKEMVYTYIAERRAERNKYKMNKKLHSSL